MNDCIEVDEDLFCENNMGDVYIDMHRDMQVFFEDDTNVTASRQNSDTSLNNYGHKFIDFCRSQSLYILNGRTRGDNCGAVTCKNVSCVDYFICSLDIMYNINNLEVHEFCSLLSDAHSPVAISLSFNNLGHKYFNLTNLKEDKIRLLDATKQISR